jgi:hypothetical protein
MPLVALRPQGAGHRRRPVDRKPFLILMVKNEDMCNAGSSGDERGAGLSR